MNATHTLLLAAVLAIAAAPSAARAGDTGPGADRSSADRSTDPALPGTRALGDGSELAPCVLVTRAEAGRALGAPVPAGVAKTVDQSLQSVGSVRTQYCAYGPDVLVGRYALGSGARTAFGRHRRSLAASAGYQDVAGVGDEAFAARGQLNVRRGGTGLIIDVGQARGTASTELRTEKALALLALARL